MATGLNLAFAIFLSPEASASLVPVQSEEIGGASTTCIGNEDEDSFSASYIFAQNITIEEGPVCAAHDPSLLKMPHRDFKAYVRPDVATFYQKEPRSMRPSSHVFNGQAGKFINLTPDRLGLYW